MANTSRGLGKGLSALLGDAALRSDVGENLYQLPISQVECNADQPRRRFDDDALADKEYWKVIHRRADIGIMISEWRKSNESRITEGPK